MKLIFLYSAILICITIPSNLRKVSSKPNNWRHFPTEKDCTDYHKPCRSDADCYRCQNGTLNCRESKSPNTNGITLSYCRPKHEDDPHKKRENPSQGANGFKSYFQRLLMDNINVDTPRKGLWKLIIGNFLRRRLDGVMQSIQDDFLKSMQEDVMNLIKDDVMQSNKDDVINPKRNDVIHSNKDDDINSRPDNDITGATAMKERPSDMLAKRGN